MNRAHTIQAAGGVVWRVGSGDNGAQIEVAIIHRPRYDDWSIPKGKLAPGESEIEGALREVFEETGCRVQLGRSLGEIRYLKKSGGHTREKVVHYWAMRATGGTFSPSREVDELRWLTLDEARDQVTRATDIEVLERFARRPAMTGLGAAGPPRERRQPRQVERRRPPAPARRDRARSRPRSWCGCCRGSAWRR